jgi:hypothetical protein
MATFEFPNFGKFEGAATTGTLKRIVAETLFDALAPFNALVGGGEGCADEVRKFTFDVASIQASVADHLHPFWRDVRDHSRDEVESTFRSKRLV